MAEVQYLLFVGFSAILFLLRMDARRFRAAEWDDGRGGPRAWLQRLSWYVLGVGLALLIFALHPAPVSELNLVLGPDRQVAIGFGLIYAVGGTAAAFVVTLLSQGRVTLPRPGQYIGAAVNSVGTAFIDEFLFRGVILGLLLALGLSDWLAIGAAAAIYAAAIAVSSGVQSPPMLALTFGVGVVGGMLVVITSGIGAAIVGHAVTRFALFMFTGRRGTGAARRWDLMTDAASVMVLGDIDRMAVDGQGRAG